MTPRPGAAAEPATTSKLDVERLRLDFPILSRSVRGKPLVYLDNAATAQKPTAVIERERTYYLEENANIHRGVHFLSEKATKEYEAARSKVARFLGATSAEEIVFVRGATEGINLVAASWGRTNVHAGDEIVITTMEHHSNIVPWQMLAKERQATLRVAPIDDAGDVIIDDYRKMLGPKTKIVAFGHVSNALGTVNPVREMADAAHAVGAKVLVDGAQAAPHVAIDAAALGADFYVVSAHKMFGPTGVGALWARRELLEAMPPWQGGGDMIASVTFEETRYNAVPFKFEAGTPNIAGGVAFGAAIDYLDSVGMSAIAAWEHELLDYATAKVVELPGVRVVGTAKRKAGVLSFVVAGVHPHDIGTILDREGIAIRTGHHCAQPVMHRFGIPATARASFAFYNTFVEIDALVAGLRRVIEMFR